MCWLYLCFNNIWSLSEATRLCSLPSIVVTKKKQIKRENWSSHWYSLHIPPLI